MEELIYWVWLSRIKGLGNKKIKLLLDKYKTPKNIWSVKEEELIKINGIGEALARNLVNIGYKSNLDQYIEYMTKNKIEVIHINDKYYPEQLKNIYDPPIVIYLKGNKQILSSFGIGIVGCREYSQYGMKVAIDFSYKLSKCGVTIISGLAKGIDTYAHVGCLKAKGSTIAVLGNGLDTIYPSQNKELAKKIILSGGAVISEYIIGTKPSKYNFPARNRIISGLSRGVLVVEAKEKSGTLITTDFAIEQGRDVFCIPGNINNMNSIGTNKLIGEGAKLVQNVEDILTEYK